MTFGGLDALFNPAKRHMEEEKLRLQSTREEVGDASGGKRIDLDSGRVRLDRTAADDPVEGEQSIDGQAGDPESDEDVNAPAGADRAQDVGGGDTPAGSGATGAADDGTSARSAGRDRSGETQAARRARERRSKPVA